jgi:hypothetical protein
VTRPIIVRWTLSVSPGNCHGCNYLHGMVFRLDARVLAPLHEHCNCRRLVIPTGNMSAPAFANLVAQADRNGARAAAITARAVNLMRRG